MDALDIAILHSLAQNARRKASAISQEISLSVSAVIERIRKMEDSGIIQGYTTVLDQKRLGNDISAYMEVCLEHPKYCEGFVAQALALENVLTCHYLTGDFDFMLYLVAKSSEALEAIHRQIKGIEGVSSTKTHFVLQAVKENTCLLPKGE